MNIKVYHHGLLYSASAHMAELPESQHPIIVHTPASASVVACMMHAAPQIDPPPVFKRQAQGLQARLRASGLSITVQMDMTPPDHPLCPWNISRWHSGLP